MLCLNLNIYIDNVTIKECNFINLKGNVVLTYLSKITIIRTAFMNSTGYDGITLFKQSKVVIGATYFTCNKPSKFGVLYAFNNTTLTVFNSSFGDNRVDLIGIILIQNSQAWFNATLEHSICMRVMIMIMIKGHDQA